MPDLDFIHLALSIDEVVLFDYNGIVTQNSIVSMAKAVEATLLAADEDETKVRVLFELTVEVMQNILSYSADSVDMGNNTFESRGSVLISHTKEEEFYNIYASNKVFKDKQQSLISNIDDVNKIPMEELKEVYNQRRRDRRRNHERGAGLGFLDMSRKSKNKLTYTFRETDKEDKVNFDLHIKV